MSHHTGLEDSVFETNAEAEVAPAAAGPVVAFLARLLDGLNRLIIVASQVALVAASLVLSYSVLARTFLKQATYWQDEAAVFLLVGATFLSAAYVQQKRGHIGIEALTGLLSPRVNRIRLMGVDAASFLFCAFFAWKSWVLAEEAFIDGQVSSSTWAPPLAIPYTIMATGMTLLSIQLLLQFVLAIAARPSAPGILSAKPV